MFEADDLTKYRMFKNIVDQGEYKLEGRAVIPAAHLFQWFYGLEKGKQNALQNKGSEDGKQETSRPKEAGQKTKKIKSKKV